MVSKQLTSKEQWPGEIENEDLIAQHYGSEESGNSGENNYGRQSCENRKFEKRCNVHYMQTIKKRKKRESKTKSKNT